MAHSVAGDPLPPSLASSVAGDELVAPRRLRQLVRDGPLRIFVLVASVGGLYGLYDAACPPEWPWHVGEDEGGGDLQLLVGFVLAHSWLFASSSYEARDEAHAYMRQCSTRAFRGAKIFGFVDYPIVEVACLEDAIVLRGGLGEAHRLDRVRGRHAIVSKPSQAEPVASDILGSVLDRWAASGAPGPPRLVQLGFAMAASVCRGTSSMLHTVPISQRVRQSSLLVPREPKPRLLQAFISEARLQHRQSHALVADPRQLPAWASQLAEPDLVLDWLESTAFAKDIRQSANAAKAFIRVVARSSKLSRTVLSSELLRVSYTTLRDSRVRLDIVAMMAWRSFWAAMVDSQKESLHLYLLCDASPQKGSEYFAATVDMFDGVRFRRWLMPCVVLDPTLMDANGKALALLWQAFLLSGPQYHQVRSFCQHIRSITTDMGTERLIVDMRHLYLSDLYKLLDPRFDPGPQPNEQWLWPEAVGIPGWKHAWDLLLQKGLSSMTFFQDG